MQSMRSAALAETPDNLLYFSLLTKKVTLELQNAGVECLSVAFFLVLLTMMLIRQCWLYASNATVRRSKALSIPVTYSSPRRHSKSEKRVISSWDASSSTNDISGAEHASTAISDSTHHPSGKDSKLEASVDEAMTSGARAVAKRVPKSAKEAAALAAMREAVLSRGLSLDSFHRGESVDSTLLRYLRACRGRVKKATAMYARTWSWRRETGVEELRALTREQALGFDPAKLQSFVPHAQTGIDRSGRPIIIKHFGVTNLSRAVAAGFTLDVIARYNIWLNEQYMDALARAGACTWTVIIDGATWTPAKFLFDSNMLRLVYRTAIVDAAHYPELLHTIVCVNCPPTFTKAWNVFRRWLEEDTQAKIHFVSAEGASEVLDALADEHQRPVQYGGTAPALDPWPEQSGVLCARSRATAKAKRNRIS